MWPDVRVSLKPKPGGKQNFPRCQTLRATAALPISQHGVVERTRPTIERPGNWGHFDHRVTVRMTTRADRSAYWEAEQYRKVLTTMRDVCHAALPRCTGRAQSLAVPEMRFATCWWPLAHARRIRRHLPLRQLTPSPPQPFFLLLPPPRPPLSLASTARVDACVQMPRKDAATWGDMNRSGFAKHGSRPPWIRVSRDSERGRVGAETPRHHEPQKRRKGRKRQDHCPNGANHMLPGQLASRVRPPRYLASQSCCFHSWGPLRCVLLPLGRIRIWTGGLAVASRFGDGRRGRFFRLSLLLPTAQPFPFVLVLACI